MFAMYYRGHVCTAPISAVIIQKRLCCCDYHETRTTLVFLETTLMQMVIFFFFFFFFFNFTENKTERAVDYSRNSATRRRQLPANYF